MAGDNKSTEVLVAEHTVQLGYIVGAIGEIKDTLKEISHTQRNIEVVMERQATHEEKNVTEHQRLHSRIDEIENDIIRINGSIKDIVDTHKLKCDVLEPKAHNGDKAYKVLIWVLTGVGVLVLNTAYQMFIAGAKV